MYATWEPESNLDMCREVLTTSTLLTTINYTLHATRYTLHAIDHYQLPRY